MGPEQHQAIGEIHNWLNMLWASPSAALLLLLKKDVRDWLRDKLTPKERREDVIQRAEFEARHAELKEDFRNGFVDLGDKLMAHAAQARVDNRELKSELKADIGEIRTDVKDTGRDLFNKMDNFLAMLSMRQK